MKNTNPFAVVERLGRSLGAGRWLCLLLLLGFGGCWVSMSPGEPDRVPNTRIDSGQEPLREPLAFPKKTPLVALVADPLRFYGRDVTVNGLVAIGQYDVIGFSSELMENGIAENCVLLDLSRLTNAMEFRGRANGRWCYLRGRVEPINGDVEWFVPCACTLVVTNAIVMVDRGSKPHSNPVSAPNNP